MTLDAPTLFKLCNLLASSGWAALVWNLLRRRPAGLWPGVIVPIVLAVAYAALVVTLMPSSNVDFGSLAGVQALFGQPWWVLAGWCHYLAFDLLVGAWETNQAQALRLPRPAVLACLLLTFMLGPMGWLAFVVLRQWATRRSQAAGQAA